MNGLYRYIHNGQIIYIGKTDRSFESRINGHAREAKFKPYKGAAIEVAILANKAETKGLEALLINKHKPILNAADKYETASAVEFGEPAWMPYSVYCMSKTAEETEKDDGAKARRIRKTQKEAKRVHAMALENEVNGWAIAGLIAKHGNETPRRLNGGEYGIYLGQLTDDESTALLQRLAFQTYDGQTLSWHNLPYAILMDRKNGGRTWLTAQHEDGFFDPMFEALKAIDQGRRTDGKTEDNALRILRTGMVSGRRNEERQRGRGGLPR